MFGRRERRVVCIACGDRIERSRAREYDKHGDRWTRENKSFEYLCKPCFRDLDNHDRDGLEAALQAAGAGERPTSAFLSSFLADAKDVERE